MTVALTVLHVFVCVFLIAVVLLQRGKGAEIGAVFGSGASSTVFGSRGAGNFLTRLTTISAVIFMATSLSLSYLWTESASERLFQDGAADEATQQEQDKPLFEDLGTVAPESTPQAADTPSSTPAPEAPTGSDTGSDTP